MKTSSLWPVDRNYATVTQRPGLCGLIRGTTSYGRLSRHSRTTEDQFFPGLPQGQVQYQ